MRSSEFRNSELFLRNSFQSSGEWGFPLVKKQSIDCSNIDLISYSDIGPRDEFNHFKGVHFFIDDYRFEKIYDHPGRSLDRLKEYKFVLGPDYSLYSEMDPWRQIESVGKSRWLSAYWQREGLTVIPTISWAQPSSFRFCFDGVEKGCIVAVGMIGCKRERISFMRGYEAMMREIEPEKAICFGTPFPEMRGDLIVVDYMATRKVVRYGR